MKKTAQVFVLFLLIGLVSCTLPLIGEYVPLPSSVAPGDGVVETISLDTPQPSEMPTIAPTLTPEPTPTPQVYRLWVAPYLPAGITHGMVAPVALEVTTTLEEANFRLGVAQDGIPISQLVYVLVAPFPALENNASLEKLRQSWQGEATGMFRKGNLYVTRQTRMAFTALWGKPQGDFVQTVENQDLLSTVWAQAPAWALLPFEDLEPRWKVLPVDGMSPLWKTFDLQTYALSLPVSLTGEDQELAGKLAESLVANVAVPLNRRPGKLTTVVLTGVTALVRATAVEMEQLGILHPAQDLGPMLQEADILHISNEVPFANGCPPPTPYNDRLIFCSSPAYIELLEAIGTDVVELTGDHFSDWGPEATLYTFDLYDEEGWLYYGGGRTIEDGQKPALFEQNGNKIAFLGCNAKGGYYTPSEYGLPGAVFCHFDQVAAEIARLKKEGYLVIMTFQHHEVYSFSPNPQMVEDFQFVADAGAAIVSGSQAHQPHGMAFYGDSFIMYGMGNMFFDQLLISENTSRAMVARHVIYDGRHISTEIFPIFFSDFSRPRYMESDEADRLLTQLFEASDWGSLVYGNP